MFTLQNNTKLTLIHNNYKLLPNEIINVPDEIAKIWLKVKGVIEYKNPTEAKQEKVKLEEENKKLKEEIKALKTKQSAKTAKTTKKAK